MGFFQEERQTVEDVYIKINDCEKANEDTTMTRSLGQAEQDEIQRKGLVFASRAGEKEKRMDTNSVGLQNWEIKMKFFSGNKRHRHLIYCRWGRGSKLKTNKQTIMAKKVKRIS